MRNLLSSLTRRAFTLASVVLRRPLLPRVASLRVIVFIALRASYYQSRIKLSFSFNYLLLVLRAPFFSGIIVENTGGIGDTSEVEIEEVSERGEVSREGAGEIEALLVYTANYIARPIVLRRISLYFRFRRSSLACLTNSIRAFGQAPSGSISIKNSKKWRYIDKKVILIVN